MRFIFLLVPYGFRRAKPLPNIPIAEKLYKAHLERQKKEDERKGKRVKSNDYS